MSRTVRLKLGDPVYAALEERAAAYGVSVASLCRVWLADRALSPKRASNEPHLSPKWDTTTLPAPKPKSPKRASNEPHLSPKWAGTDLALSDQSIEEKKNIHIGAEPWRLSERVIKIISDGHDGVPGPTHHPAAFERALWAALRGEPPHRRTYTEQELLQVAEHYTREWVGTPYARGLNPSRLYGEKLGDNVSLLGVDTTSKATAQPRTQAEGRAQAFAEQGDPDSYDLGDL